MFYDYLESLSNIMLLKFERDLFKGKNINPQPSVDLH